MIEEYFEDDRPIVIPEYIKNMSKAQLDAEIKELEIKARKERDQIIREKQLKAV